MAATSLDKTSLEKYLRLPMPDKKSLLTYVWVDKYGESLGCKTRVLDFVPKSPKEVPLWSYPDFLLEGETYDRIGESATIDKHLYPVALYRDPFQPGNNNLVLCDTYYHTKQPTPTRSNHRVQCAEVMNKAKNFHPWFGIEQEYTLMDAEERPYGWPKHGFPGSDGPHHCGVGADKAFGREVVDSHIRACLYAGVKIAGTNGEVLQSSWEFQIGPCEGIAAGDDVWMARYILHRVAEDFSLKVSFDPKPVAGKWAGTGMHTNFSTEDMRKSNGIVAINNAIEKLSKKHDEHLAISDISGGKDNQRRLTGKHEAPPSEFISDVANRGASVRIPRTVAEEGKGYLEDRRPGANADPYLVTAALVKTICLDE